MGGGRRRTITDMFVLGTPLAATHEASSAVAMYAIWLKAGNCKHDVPYKTSGACLNNLKCPIAPRPSTAATQTYELHRDVSKSTTFYVSQISSDLSEWGIEKGFEAQRSNLLQCLPASSRVPTTPTPCAPSHCSLGTAPQIGQVLEIMMPFLGSHYDRDPKR